VILLQKYSGNNHLNNQVHIDFKKQEIRFRPVRGKWSDKRLFLSFYCLNLSYVLLIMGLYFIIGADVLQYYPLQKTLYIIYCILTILLITFIVSLPYFDHSWRKHRYPKYNAALLWIIQEKKRSKKITSKDIRKNYFILPKFKNVKLTYKLTEDFTNIRTIEILNTYHNNADEWYAVFTWNKKPKKGSMLLNYH